MIIGEREVFVILMSVVTFALLYMLCNRAKYAPSISLLIISSAMFAYTFVGINGDDPHHWFVNDQPWFVSRIVLAGIALISIIGAWRARSHIKFPNRRLIALAALAALIVPATIAPMILGFAPKVAVPTRAIIAFSILLTTMLWLALFLGTIETRLPLTPSGSAVAATTMILLCATISILGFLEVAWDIGFARNMFISGVIETRAASTAANPNWLALCLAPFIFAALFLAARGHYVLPGTLIVFATIGLIASGSRSVISMLAVSIIILFVLGRASGPSTYARILRAIGVLVGSGIIGLNAGLLFAAALGQVAVDRYLTLLIRLIIWPVLVFTQTAAFESLLGRFDVGTMFGEKKKVGAGVIDNAYLFLYGANPLVLGLLVIFLAGVTYMAVCCWYRTKNINSCLSVSMCSFVVLIGVAAQVYWAFPVWIALSVILAWTIGIALDDHPTEKQV